VTPEERLDIAAERCATAEAVRAEAEAERDDAIREAAAAGLSLRAIAAHVHLSHQRVQQILKG
jgi:hypothetical protein